MELRGTEQRVSKNAASSDQLLATRYAQLMQWAIVLTRNDRPKAEEIVQEFCLYITLTKPDLSQVANLDGYLYTCLRHVYTSNLARASRDAQRTVSLQEYDSFAMALSSGTSSDAMQRQNDLRRACAYAVWRKESSKTASYFVLHFFHGYARQEIAAVARVTMPAVYNKLKAARSEVGAYLYNAGKLRVVDREEPPPPNLSWYVVPVSELFSELRRTILNARLGACLPEQQLSALYDTEHQTPIPCDLLAHIVSCERCLAVVDQIGCRPTLKDREPLDVFGYSPRAAGGTPGIDGEVRLERATESVKRKWKRLYDHRPNRLSIAVNGEIIATHDVRSERNRLSARIESGVRVDFVEVFSDQDVRLALLPVEATPFAAPSAQNLRVDLSDARWLELSLRFDGLGLESEVCYADAVLAQTIEEEPETPVVIKRTAPTSRVSAFFYVARQRLNALAIPAIAWSVALLAAFAFGYWTLLNHEKPLQPTAVLHNASQAESNALRGQTEHEVERIEEWSSAGVPQGAGTIDLWKDGDGARYIRRLFDDKHQLLAVEWQAQGRGTAKKHATRRLDSSLWQFWGQQLSVQAFAVIPDEQPKLLSTKNGFEITKSGPAQGFPELVSATLVLNLRYEAIEQRLQVQTAHGIRQLRFIRDSYVLRPARSVPDDTFAPAFEVGTGSRTGRIPASPGGLTQGADIQQAELELEVLYALGSLDADTGVPIEVSRTSTGQVRVEGVVANEELKQKIYALLRGLGETNLLELKIAVAHGARGRISAPLPPVPLESYEVSQTQFAADTPVRRFMESKNLAGEPLNRSVAQYSSKALSHAQRALQHAYALDRLGSSINGDELHAISKQSQLEWTKMVQAHASGVQTELRALQEQLAEVWPHTSEAKDARGPVTGIDNPVEFAKVAKHLRAQVSKLNQQTGELFTANARAVDQTDQGLLLEAIMDSEVLHNSVEISEFATRLSETTAGK